MSEYVDEVKEQIERMRNVVFAAHSILLNNELCIIDNESTHYQQTKIKMNLVNHLRSEEDVSQRK